jgi:hypothetical protein
VIAWASANRLNRCNSLRFDLEGKSDDKETWMSDIQAIARTVSALAAPGLKPKDLMAAVRKQHPEASKKEVSRAASAEGDPDQAHQMQELALASRGTGSDDGVEDRATPIVTLKRKRKSRN